MFNKIYRKNNKYLAHIILLFVINTANGMFDSSKSKEDIKTLVTKGKEFHQHMLQHYFPNNFYANMLIGSNTKKPIQIGIGMQIESFPVASSLCADIEHSKESFQKMIGIQFSFNGISINKFKGITVMNPIFPNEEGIVSYKKSDYYGDYSIFYHKNINLDQEKIEEQLHNKNNDNRVFFTIASRELDPGNATILFFSNDGKTNNYFHSQTTSKNNAHMEQSALSAQVTGSKNAIIPIIKDIHQIISFLLQQQKLYFQPQQTQQQQYYLQKEYFQTQRCHSYQEPSQEQYFQEQQYDFSEQYLSQKLESYCLEQEEHFNDIIKYSNKLGCNVILSLACFDQNNNYDSSIGICMEQLDYPPLSRSFNSAYDSINSFYRNIQEWLNKMNITINQSPEDPLPNSFYEENVLPIIDINIKFSLLHKNTFEYYYNNNYGYITHLSSTNRSIKDDSVFSQYDFLKERLQPIYKKHLTFAFCIDPLKDINFIGFFRIPIVGHHHFAYVDNAMKDVPLEYENIAIKMFIADTTGENIEALMQKSPFMNNFIHIYESCKDILLTSHIFSTKNKKFMERFISTNYLYTNAEKILGAVTRFKYYSILTLLLGNTATYLVPMTILLNESSFPANPNSRNNQNDSFHYFKNSIEAILKNKNIVASLRTEQLPEKYNNNYFIAPEQKENKSKKNGDLFLFVKNTSYSWEEILKILYDNRIKKQIVFALCINPDTNVTSNPNKDDSHNIIFYHAPFENNNFYYFHSEIIESFYIPVPKFIQRNVDPLRLLSMNPSSKLVNTFAGYYQEMMLTNHNVQEKPKEIIMEEIYQNRFLPEAIKQAGREQIEQAFLLSMFNQK